MKSEIEIQLAQLPGAGKVETRPDGLWMDAPGLDVMIMAVLMNNFKARLSTVTAIALEDGETQLIYHFAIGGQAINIKTLTNHNSIVSIATAIHAASWIEREIHDLFSVDFTGHPNLKRLILPPQLPQGLFREQGGAAGKAERALRGE